MNNEDQEEEDPLLNDSNLPPGYKDDDL